MPGSDNVTHFTVQTLNDTTGTWRNINTTIKVSEYMKSGRTRDQAEALARQEADKQVSGWSAAYPLRQYRVLPTHGDSW